MLKLKCTYLVLLLITCSNLRAEFHDPREAYRVRSIVSETPTRTAIYWGTCFPVKQGVLTAAHIIKDNAIRHEVEIAGVWYAARLVSIDKKNDIALLEICENHIKRGRCSLGKPPIINDTVTLLSSSESRPIVVSKGTLQAETLIDAPMKHGCSGSPVFDLSGQVVGMIVGIVKPKSAVLVPVDVLQGFIDKCP